MPLEIERGALYVGRKTAPAANVKTFQTGTALEQHLQPLIGRIDIQRQVLQPFSYQQHITRTQQQELIKRKRTDKVITY